MPQISIIKKSDIQEARRFDAEFFKPEYLEIERILKKIKSKKIETLSKCTNYGLNIEPEYRDEGVKFIRAQNLKEYSIEGKVLKIPVKIEDLNETEILDKGDLMIVRSGANVGDIGIVTDEYKKSTFGSYIIKFDIKESINPIFAYIFLKTKFGRLQTTRFRSGTAQPNISIPNLDKILIPDFDNDFQKAIEEKYFEAKQKQTQSKQLYKEAERLLLKEVGLLDYEPEHILSFETTKKETDEAGRFDAEYFQPKYDEIIKKIEEYKNGWDFVRNIVDRKKGVEVGSEAYRQDGMSFGRVADCSINGVADTGKKISKELYQELKNDYQPKQDDILFTKDGTIGLSYVVKEEFEVILSGAFLRLSIKDKYQTFEKECLSLIFNSIISKMQVEKLSGGAIIAHLKPSDFEKFKIPLINLKIQKQIAKKIIESHKLRKESKELLEEAKRRVEDEIERG